MAAAPTTSLKLDIEVKSRLQKLAATRQRSAHWLMREAIEQYVDREERRAQFRQDAIDAWSAYQSDGLHVTGGEADDWLARLEAGETAKPPKPHR